MQNTLKGTYRVGSGSSQRQRIGARRVSQLHAHTGSAECPVGMGRWQQRAGERSSLACTRSRSDIVAQASCLGKRAAPRSSPPTGRTERTVRLHSRSGGRRTRPMAHACSPETRTVPPTRADSNTKNVHGDCTERRRRKRRAGAMVVADDTGGRRRVTAAERWGALKAAPRSRESRLGDPYTSREFEFVVDPAARRRSGRWGRQAEKPRTSVRELLVTKAEYVRRERDGGRALRSSARHSAAVASAAQERVSSQRSRESGTDVDAPWTRRASEASGSSAQRRWRGGDESTLDVIKQDPIKKENLEKIPSRSLTRGNEAAGFLQARSVAVPPRVHLGGYAPSGDACGGCKHARRRSQSGERARGGEEARPGHGRDRRRSAVLNWPVAVYDTEDEAMLAGWDEGADDTDGCMWASASMVGPREGDGSLPRIRDEGTRAVARRVCTSTGASLARWRRAERRVRVGGQVQACSRMAWVAEREARGGSGSADLTRGCQNASEERPRACVWASQIRRVRMRGRPVAGVESSTALMPQVSSRGGEPEARTRMHRGLAQVVNTGRGCRRLGAGGTAYGHASETRCGDGAAQRPETLSRRVEESSTHGEWRTLLGRGAAGLWCARGAFTDCSEVLALDVALEVAPPLGSRAAAAPGRGEGVRRGAKSRLVQRDKAMVALQQPPAAVELPRRLGGWRASSARTPAAQSLHGRRLDAGGTSSPARHWRLERRVGVALVCGSAGMGSGSSTGTRAPGRAEAGAGRRFHRGASSEETCPLRRARVGSTHESGRQAGVCMMGAEQRGAGCRVQLAPRARAASRRGQLHGSGECRANLDRRFGTGARFQAQVLGTRSCAPPAARGVRRCIPVVRQQETEALFTEGRERGGRVMMWQLGHNTSEALRASGSAGCSRLSRSGDAHRSSEASLWVVAVVEVREAATKAPAHRELPL
ncbi:hypothetical protein B0H14DRAFT_2604304 [Mycena olivaceomarginata]|nr:hypothetical protein B0H14DRAFT_2604304 [Mycena olivaceomarginata]